MVQLHSFEIWRKSRIDFWSQQHFKKGWLKISKLNYCQKSVNLWASLHACWMQIVKKDLTTRFFAIKKIALKGLSIFIGVAMVTTHTSAKLSKTRCLCCACWHFWWLRNQGFREKVEWNTVSQSSDEIVTKGAGLRPKLIWLFAV